MGAAFAVIFFVFIIVWIAETTKKNGQMSDDFVRGTRRTNADLEQEIICKYRPNCASLHEAYCKTIAELNRQGFVPCYPEEAYEDNISAWRADNRPFDPNKEWVPPIRANVPAVYVKSFAKTNYLYGDSAIIRSRKSDYKMCSGKYFNREERDKLVYGTPLPQSSGAYRTELNDSCKLCDELIRPGSYLNYPGIGHVVVEKAVGWEKRSLWDLQYLVTSTTTNKQYWIKHNSAKQYKLFNR